MAGIEEAAEMKPEEYWTYFEDFIFVADKESDQKNSFASTIRQGGLTAALLYGG